MCKASLQSFYCVGLLDILPLSQHDRVHVGLVAIYLVSVLATEGSILEYGATLGGQYKHNNTRLSQRQSGVEAGEFRALGCNQCVCESCPPFFKAPWFALRGGWDT